MKERFPRQSWRELSPSEMSKVLTGKGDDYYQRQLGLSGVQSSFDADSLPDYSEFDSESVTLDYFKESC